MPEIDKVQEKSKEKHKRFRSDRYSKMLERQQILRECESISALAKAEAILKAEKEYLQKNGVRVNWPGKKALEEAYKQTMASTSLPPSSSSTSISYSSNIHVEAKLPNLGGGSLPASPKLHTPLHKTDAIPPQAYDLPPMARLSFASASPIRGNPVVNTDQSFNFSFPGNASAFASSAQMTSTPVADNKQAPLFSFAQPVASQPFGISNTKISATAQTRPFSGFAPSASNSTDSGKFSSDNATGRLDGESAKPPPFSLFGGFNNNSKPTSFQSHSTTTVTSLPASTMPSFPAQSLQSNAASTPIAATPPREFPSKLTASAPIVAAFKPPKVVEEVKDPPKQSLPVALRWIRLQRDLHRKFNIAVKAFTDNPENNEVRRIIKMEIGNLFDRTLQKRPSKDELDTSLAQLTNYFNRLMAGDTMSCTLTPERTFTFNVKNEGMLIYLTDVVSRRIIDMIKLDPALVEIARLVHSLLTLKIPNFKKIFRQILANSMFIIQIASDDLIFVLDERFTANPGYFSINCLDSERTCLKLFCYLEMYDSPPNIEKLSELCGTRLLYEFCVACNVLPQVPITTLSVLFEMIHTAGSAFVTDSCPYRKDFLQIVFPRLNALVAEDLTAEIDGIAVRFAVENFGTHLQKMHAIVRQRVMDSFEKRTKK